MSREGKVLGCPSQPGAYGGVRISPDGARAALSVINASGDREVWALDFARGIKTRVASEKGALIGLWSPDGRNIVYYRALGPSIFQRNAGGAGSPETLLESSRPIYADDFSPDGRVLLFEQLEDNGTRSLRLLPYPPSSAADGKTVLYWKAASLLSNAQFSPNGKWVSYTSDESGQAEVYVQSFPKPDTRVLVSNGGGSFARWRRDGKELLYRAPDARLMAAAVRESARPLEFATPTALFRLNVPPVGDRFFPYDVAPDGRILALSLERSEGAPLTVLINWQAGLKK